ncbi:hypothetical protein PBV87_11540 [Niameybacter massiliensis]|uniref:Uncharacterized protein n=1 Tax=Holtiella tumoricola TaxID=3018743 RepID=A0AA42DNS6_9FIRM|nr:hypothetical protein [Holtiella tumoricola]MDA3732116.1 hypothetical protein [Holtiella tumoricola]
MKTIKEKINRLKKAIFCKSIALDSLFLMGTVILIATNFMVNVIFGMYSVAFLLIALSIYLSLSIKK